ncbi:MAG: hypothetical protein GY913_09430, partial [Proteobacteria bacterium]|nr:hypothetical protein [Pseudomonadota bacterium]
DDDPDVSDPATWYLDVDGDGVGGDAFTWESCDAPSGYVDTSDDCDDADATAYPDAEEVCDGDDEDCDGVVDEGTVGLSPWHADTDGDGFGDADDSSEACDAPSGYVADDSDCDDGDAEVNPDATEVCNGLDDDCDGDADPDDLWWDADWPYRLPLTVTASSWDVDGPPVLVEVDFSAALDDLGDSDDFDPDSLRVVVQDCSLDLPELPSQFLDELVGLEEKSDETATADDGHGTVAFLYDEDGDTTSLETLGAGDSVELALYFGTSGTDPGYATDLSVATSALENASTAATLDATAGGLLDSLTLDGGSVLMSQTDSCCGNGAYTSTWSDTPMYVSGTVTVLDEGPVVGVVEAESALSTYDVRYRYWMFDGRPEVWAKVTMETNASTTFSHPSEYTSGIRPWESQQSAISGSATFELDSSYLWADVSDGSEGVAFGYVEPPAYALSLSNYDPYLIVVGNDLEDAGAGASATWAAGTAFVEDVVMVLVPHAGDWADVQDTVWGLMDGVSTSLGSAETP